MSTTKRPSHLLDHPFARLGLGLGLALTVAGCSTSSGTRTGSLSKMKTFLAVGDKPLPVVTGEPGSSVVADRDAETDASVGPRPRSRLEGRISGRVYDPDGRPVPDARIRLAVGGARGGKVVTASTDRSGAFTLHGLRPGSAYTVIAESEDAEGPLTGRINARTSDTGLAIQLAPDATSTPRASSNPPRVNRVSDRQRNEPNSEVEPEPEVQDNKARATTRRVNEEDLPPATEAEALEDTTSARRPRPVAAKAGPEPWRKGGSAATSRVAEEGDEADFGPEPVKPRRLSSKSYDAEARPSDATMPLDEGPNPLPPALEPGEESHTSNARGPRSADPDPIASETPRFASHTPSANDPTPRTRPIKGRPDPLPDPFASTPDRLASTLNDSPSRPSLPPVDDIPADRAPGALVVVPETFGPVVVHEEAPSQNPVTRSNAPLARPRATDPATRPAPSRTMAALSNGPAARSTRPRPHVPTPAARVEREPESPAPSTTAFNDMPPPADLSALATPDAASQSETTPPPVATSTPGPRKRPTWGELASADADMPPLESEIATGRPKADSGVARRSLVAESTTNKAEATPKPDDGQPSCDYDDRLRRIVDFSLPNLKGKPVHFRDLDADLVLIDFWGTWCPPCIRSIPHLVDLQERLGKKLVIVGVACEPDAPEASRARVDAAARKLNVNYPILLSRNDGSCPLQEALHVQAFPTMVLVDREGRVLWRDQGATPANLARLDHILEAPVAADASQARR